jgi:hypothetical protein
MLSRWRRRTVVGCAEAVRRIPGAAHLRATPIVRTPGCVRRRSTGSARSAGSTRPAGSMPWSPRFSRPAGSRPAGSMPWSPRSTGSARPARSRAAGSTGSAWPRSRSWTARPARPVTTRAARPRTARPRSTRPRTARSTGSTRSRTTRPARSAGPRPVGEGPMPSGSWLQRRGIGGLDAHRQCRNADACGNRRTCHALHIHTC